MFAPPIYVYLYSHTRTYTIHTSSETKRVNCSWSKQMMSEVNERS